MMAVHVTPEVGQRGGVVVRMSGDRNRVVVEAGSYVSISGHLSRAMSVSHHNQCDQIGQFFELLGNKFSCKSSPNIMVTFWVILNNTTFLSKLFGYFWGNVGKIGQLFIPSSGHTDHNLPCRLD